MVARYEVGVERAVGVIRCGGPSKGGRPSHQRSQPLA